MFPRISTHIKMIQNRLSKGALSDRHQNVIDFTDKKAIDRMFGENEKARNRNGTMRKCSMKFGRIPLDLLSESWISEGKHCKMLHYVLNRAREAQNATYMQCPPSPGLGRIQNYYTGYVIKRKLEDEWGMELRLALCMIGIILNPIVGCNGDSSTDDSNDNPYGKADENHGNVSTEDDASKSKATTTTTITAQANGTTTGKATDISTTKLNIQARINGNNVNIRSLPTLDGDIVAKLNHMDTVTAIESTVEMDEINDASAPWYHIRLSPGREGWIFGQFLATAQDRPKDMVMIPGIRAGGVNWTTSQDEILALYGEDATANADVPVGEGMTEKGTVLYEGTPNEAVVLYEDDAMERPSSFRIDNNGSSWRVEGGVRIGLTLKDLAALNGKPVTIVGYGWDYGGTVTNWNDGKFASRSLRVTTTMSSSIPNDDYRQMAGSDTQIRTDKQPLSSYLERIIVSAVSTDFRPEE